MLQRIIYYGCLILSVIVIAVFLFLAVRAAWHNPEPNGLPQSMSKSDISSLYFLGIAIFSGIMTLIMNILHY